MQKQSNLQTRVESTFKKATKGMFVANIMIYLNEKDYQEAESLDLLKTGWPFGKTWITNFNIGVSKSKEDKSYVEGATDHYENFKHNKVYLDNYGQQEQTLEGGKETLKEGQEGVGV